SCDDSLVCNGREMCQLGSCQPGPAPDCSDGLACTVDTCVESTGCRNDPMAGCAGTDAGTDAGPDAADAAADSGADAGEDVVSADTVDAGTDVVSADGDAAEASATADVEDAVADVTGADAVDAGADIARADVVDAGATDGGVDASARDAYSGSDAAVSDARPGGDPSEDAGGAPRRTGCGCRIPRRGGERPIPWIGLAVATLVARRRRRKGT
ncbi:MAG: MYXO-CTERM sorting domain-containing protein, partial [Deltaproteobacteria bacterium]